MGSISGFLKGAMDYRSKNKILRGSLAQNPSGW
jgi:hypothetical protein